MNRPTRTLLLLTALLLPPAAAACAQTPASPAQTASPAQNRPQATPEKSQEAPRRHETVRFESKLIGAPLPYNVILPADYKSDVAKNRRYPVVYLLHGLAGSAD